MGAGDPPTVSEVLQRVHYDIVLDVGYDLPEVPDDEAALTDLEVLLDEHFGLFSFVPIARASAVKASSNRPRRP